GFMLTQSTAAQSNQIYQTPAQHEAADQSAADLPALSQYASDLSRLAQQGKLERTSGHDGDIARVIDSLARTTSKAPVVVGETDFERDAIALGVAVRIAFGDVPAVLRDKRVFRLSIDALAMGAKTSEEFESRVQSVFAEAVKADGQIILFVDQLHQYAGARATTVESATIKSAIETDHLRIIGGATPEAYAQYIASEANVAKLFEVISIDGTAQTAPPATVAKDKRKSPVNAEFEGDKISPDMRELVDSVGPNDRVTAILQVDDIHNGEILALLKRYGANVDARMAQLGAIRVALPAKAIEALARSDGTNYISPDVK